MHCLHYQEATVRTTAGSAASAGTCAVGSARLPGQAASCRRGKGMSRRRLCWCRGAMGLRMPDDDAVDAWRERVAIVRFCSGIEMTEQQAQRIVQMQMGISDEEWEEMKKKDSGK